MVLGFNDTQNKDIVLNVQDVLKLNPITDAIPKQVIPTIQPVFEVSPGICNVAGHATLTNQTSSTVYTTPSDKDFFLNSVQLAILKDATSTATTVYLLATVKGLPILLLNFPCLTLTAQTLSQAVSYPKPLKLDRNTTIVISTDTNVANIKAAACFTGYTQDSGQNSI